MTPMSTSSSLWGLSVGSWSSPCMDLERARAPADLNQSKNKSIGMGDRRKERRREESMGRSREGPCAVRRRRRRARARASRRSRWCAPSRESRVCGWVEGGGALGTLPAGGDEARWHAGRRRAEARLRSSARSWSAAFVSYYVLPLNVVRAMLGDVMEYTVGNMP